MTDLLRPSPRNMKIPENEKFSLTEELHHISEQLEELISLLKDSAARTEGIQSDEPSPKDSEVMTVKEAAKLMRISLPMMYEFAKSGKVHAINIGRRVLISRSSLMALLREGDDNV